MFRQRESERKCPKIEEYYLFQKTKGSNFEQLSWTLELLTNLKTHVVEIEIENVVS